MLREHEITLRVRYQETDPMGFLHHAYYLTYFEIGRTELLRASGGNYRRMEQEGMMVVVARAECRYHRPARYDDVLRLRTRVVRVTQAKIEHEYQLFRDDTLLATGHVTLAMVDRQGSVQRIPDWLRGEDEMPAEVTEAGPGPRAG
jgi:acyl-CoA thioester hydrolase